MIDIKAEIEEIVNKYRDEEDYISPYREECEYELYGELAEYIETQKEAGNIMDGSIKNIRVVDSCGWDAGVYSVACVLEDGELYHRLIQWDVM